jgi:hypothetical protein
MDEERKSKLTIKNVLGTDSFVRRRSLSLETNQPHYGIGKPIILFIKVHRFSS